MYFRMTWRKARSSELVQVVTERRELHLLVLALPDVQAELVHLAALRVRVALDHLPVAERALREHLATSRLAQRAREPERLRHRQVRLHVHQVRALTLLLEHNHAAA